MMSDAEIMWYPKFGMTVDVYRHGVCRVVETGVTDVHDWQHFYVRTAAGRRVCVARHSIGRVGGPNWWSR